MDLSTLDVSPSKARQFAGKGITSVEDLISFFPNRYYDFRAKKNISDLQDGEICRISGVVQRRYVSKKVDIYVSDGTGELKLTWFKGCYFYSRLRIGTGWTFCGKVSEFNGQMQMVQPMLFAEGLNALSCIYPMYPKIHGMAEKYLQEKMDAGLSLLPLNPKWSERDIVAKSFGLEDWSSAIKQIHRPTSGEEWQLARRRIAFEEIYSFYEELYRRRQIHMVCHGHPMPQVKRTREFIRKLPFSLTDDQSKAIDTIIAGTNGHRSLNLLITGDVGCGKTIVAFVAAILAWENGFQTILMAPTMVLAQQHYNEFLRLASTLKISAALLTGETKKGDRERILSRLEFGSIDILIGTHAVLSPSLRFHNLGMTIVDEEHRFGTQQKAALDAFDKFGAHHISMTATPIPRSYASAIYGGCMDIVAIENMPAGRKPVITSLLQDRTIAYSKMIEEIHAGHQGYVVCPFIEESTNERFKSVLSVHTVYEELKMYCAQADPMVRVAYISGEMPQKEVLTTLDLFAAGQIHILVSTTIVEVGVNVPNATAITIINAERFGLSALHQLRGRVGRKGDQAYCYLVSDQEIEKLTALTRCSSGFKIAELDLQLRGPGEILGDEQTGTSKTFDLILRRPKMASCIRAYFNKLMCP